MTAALQQYVGNCRVRAVRRYSMVEMTGLFFALSVIGWLSGSWAACCAGRRAWSTAAPCSGHGCRSMVRAGCWLVLLLRRVAYSPALVLALGTGMCTAVEYAAGRYLLAVYGLRWWDYSMYPLNVDGLVSPLTSLVFGLGCCAAVYAAGPALADCISRLARRRAQVLCIALAVLFVLDFVWSAVHPNMGTGVTTPHGGMVVIDRRS